MNVAPELSVLWPALLAGLLVLATHVPLGQEVLKRGIVFIDLALAQGAVLGVIAAEVLGFEAHGWVVQLIAVGAALAAAALLAWSERRHRAQQEALIGSLFVVAASSALLLLHHDPHGAEHLRDVLEGQILWTEPAQLLPAALAAVLVLAAWFSPRIGRRAFYPLFALSITLSVQLVGVYLVFASLILPALAAVRLRASHRLAAGYALGLLAYAAGLALSFATDLPAAPTIVCLLAALAAAVWWLAPPVRS
jgi:zinc/manganese transport system permease protein